MPKIHTRTEHYYLLSEVAAEVAAKTGEPYSSIVDYIYNEFEEQEGYGADLYDMFEVGGSFEGHIGVDVYNELDSLLQKCSVIMMDN